MPSRVFQAFNICTSCKTEEVSYSQGEGTCKKYGLYSMFFSCIRNPYLESTNTIVEGLMAHRAIDYLWVLLSFSRLNLDSKWLQVCSFDDYSNRNMAVLPWLDIVTFGRNIGLVFCPFSTNLLPVTISWPT